MSRQRYLALCLRHLEVTNPGNPKVKARFREFLVLLEDFYQAAGKGLRIVVIPEEYQVNDALWADVMGLVPSPKQYDRDYPQKVIRRFCLEQGIPCLDLLAPLRKAEHQQRTYHLQNSHWNAWGNQIAGEELAEFLLDNGPETRIDSSDPPLPH